MVGHRIGLFWPEPGDLCLEILVALGKVRFSFPSHLHL